MFQRKYSHWKATLLLFIFFVFSPTYGSGLFASFKRKNNKKKINPVSTSNISQNKGQNQNKGILNVVKNAKSKVKTLVTNKVQSAIVADPQFQKSLRQLTTILGEAIKALDEEHLVYHKLKIGNREHNNGQNGQKVNVGTSLGKTVTNLATLTNALVGALKDADPIQVRENLEASSALLKRIMADLAGDIEDPKKKVQVIGDIKKAVQHVKSVTQRVKNTTQHLENIISKLNSKEVLGNIEQTVQNAKDITTKLNSKEIVVATKVFVMGLIILVGFKICTNFINLFFFFYNKDYCKKSCSESESKAS